MRTFRLAVVGVVAAGLVFASPSLASATNPPGFVPPTGSPRDISTQVVEPYNLSLWGKRVTVADGGLQQIATVNTGNGSLTPLETGQPGASGVADSWDGRSLAWTTTESTPQPAGPPVNTESGIHIKGPGGTVYASTYAYEVANNPDQVNTYGIANPTQCQIDAFAAVGQPATYTGAVDSHAYSVAAYLNRWVVADAGANALWSVDNRGNISTLAVLPPQPTTITAEAAAELGLPDCVVGAVYAFEPVPTDVEVGLDGSLYVTTLPGGPESPALGARGSVYKVSPSTGASTLVATGFLSATNLAIGWRGEIYVAELFAGRVSVVKNGQISKVADLPGALAVEFGIDGSLWAASGIAGPPKIVKVFDARTYWRSLLG